jgi:hypothetical protein
MSRAVNSYTRINIPSSQTYRFYIIIRFKEASFSQKNNILVNITDLCKLINEM